MKLSDLTQCPFRGDDVLITGITEDSRKVQPGFLFIATPGLKVDGRAFIPLAVEKGAVAVLVPEDSVVEVSVTVAFTPDIRHETALIAAAFYARQPQVITAVTGTSGKTSTAQFVREIEHALGHKAASIGTLGLVTDEGTEYGALTTPDAITLHRVLDMCAGRGITHAVLEASSNGIEFNRLDGVRFKAAAFTNLSRDHLDYHQTMEAYFEAKRLLFTRLLPDGAAAVLNADVPEAEVLEKDAIARGLRVMTFGKQGKDLRLIDAKADAKGQVLRLEVLGRETTVLLPVMGDFQAWNALGALGLVIGSGSDSVQATEALVSVTGVPGRLQFMGVSAKGGEVYVDYAHKPDALERVLLAMRPRVQDHDAKLGVIVGCGGDRDKGKRPLMGAIAQKKADWAIISDDNPRTEDAATIRAEMMAGCLGATNVKEIGDRAQAIAEGIAALGAHDVLIIAGKGHEPGQIVGDTVLPFDDRDEARRALGQ